MNKRVISFFATDNYGFLFCNGQQRTFTDFFFFVITRKVRVSPCKSAAKKRRLLSSAVIIICLLFITFYTECLAQPYEGRRTYSMTELKRNKWVYLEYHEGRQYSKSVIYYTDTEAISIHTYQNRKGETKSYTHRSPYYLSNVKAGRFDKSKVGKVKRGTYIINGNCKHSDTFVSQEIIMLNERELSLYWCTPPGTIGGCDTLTWTNEKFLNTAPTSIRRIKK